MNAHITTPRTVSAATIARTAVLALALINQILSAAGKPVLPIESAQLEQLISTGFTTVSALVNWWFNNSFTKEAIQADAEFERLRKSVK
jgi:SPP1 family holin